MRSPVVHGGAIDDHRKPARPAFDGIRVEVEEISPAEDGEPGPGAAAVDGDQGGEAEDEDGQEHDGASPKGLVGADSRQADGEISDEDHQPEYRRSFNNIHVS